MKVGDEVTVYDMSNYSIYATNFAELKCPVKGIVKRMYDINIVVEVAGREFELYEHQLTNENGWYGE